MVDFGYDIKDFRLVDPIFGTNEELENLFAAAKELGIKIILDFVPNHTSSEHEWFIKSKAKEDPYTDYYVWVDPIDYDDDNNPIPPNNWQSVFYGSAWEWDQGREQFYLHQFDKGQPDLDYRNPLVVQEMKDVMTFWLDKGAGGFRLDAVNHMYETEGYPDEPVNEGATDPFDYGYTDHIHTKDLNETFEMVYEWRQMIEDYRIDNPGDDVLLMLEAYANTTFTHLFYGNGDRLGAHFPFNFKIMHSAYGVREEDKPAWKIDDAIREWTDPLQSGEVSNWVLGNHDNKRAASQFGEGRVNLLHTLTMTLPGVAITYNGEEIGMVDNMDITYEQTQDPQACNRGDRENYNSVSRDPARTPFQWDDSEYAGFTTGAVNEPWLPINSNYRTLNLKNQIDDPNSPYRYYKQLVELRKHQVFVEGDHKRYVFNDGRVIAIERFTDKESYTVLLNFGNRTEKIDLTQMATAYPEFIEVILASPESSSQTNAKLKTNSIQLNPYESLVFKPFSDGDMNMDWWKNGLFYQIYPRSFKDSNGDGIGDINGIIEKLEYLRVTGVIGVWLSPVFKSPMADFGYDISDFTQVDKIFGSNDDLTRLFQAAKAIGIKIILDFVPNHTSDQHEWFLKSKAGDPKYRDYYVWKDKKGDDENGNPIPPNNWVSVFYGSAWEWDDQRQQFYLHQFDKGQPDLDYRNPEVVQEMKNVVNYWLMKGAGGFRLDAVNHMFEHEDLLDEPTTEIEDPNDYGHTDHIYTKDLDETYDIIYQFREVCDEHQKNYGGDARIMMVEAYTDIEHTHRYYGEGDRAGGQIPFNFGLITKINTGTAQNFYDVIHEWMDVLPEGQVANWVLGNHDQRRVATRYGEEMVNVLHTLTMTLPGVAITYNGEEIGMVNNNDISFEETVDPQACNKGDPENYLAMSRDPERTPFQWDDTLYAGFSTGENGEPWLPVHANYKKKNLKIQQEQEKSVYKFYQQLVNLRKDPVMIAGVFNQIVLAEYVLAFSRSHPTEGTYVVLMNLGNKDEIVDITDFVPDFPERSTVILAVPESEYDKGSIVNTNSTLLRRHESLIIKPKVEAEIREKEWWETAVFYQIYPRSFKDSDGDGVGDIRGIIEKLDHLHDIGVTATWLSPILKSPMADFGYDIEDFKNVDELFGTNEDLDELFEKAKELGIRIIMDFVPNHTSDEHIWFKESVERNPPYEDYYMWSDGKLDENGKRIPINNWVSVFYGRAWTWNEKRGQYYLHQFDKKQPDLNYRNSEVRDEMKSVLKYWLDKGAAGFRMDAVNHIMEVEDLRDDPRNPYDNDEESFGYVYHHYTVDMKETYDLIYEFREFIDQWMEENKPDEVKIMMTEAYTNITNTMLYYQSEDHRQIGAHFPFNFILIEWLNEDSDAPKFKETLETWLNNVPEGKTSNWVLGNHDKPRVGSRYGTSRIDAMNTLSMTLPGVAVTYNGDEIGMVDYRDITFKDTLDPQACNRGDPVDYKWASRDPQRTPFQWDDSDYAGFTTAEKGKPWLPIHPNYKELNLANQKDDPRSHYNIYKRLVALRKHNTMIHGDITISAINKRVLSYIRELENSESFVIVINLGDFWETIDLNKLTTLPAQMTVVTSSGESKHNTNDVITTNSLVLGPHDALVLSTNVADGAGSSSITFSVSIMLLVISIIINLF